MRIGTIRSQVKLQTLELKWQQRKQNIGQKKQNQMTPEEQMLQHFREQADSIQESREAAGIYTKIQSGATLTLEEEEYLRQNNPTALKSYEEAKQKREGYRKELENSKTKEEVEQVKLQKMGSFLAEVKSIANNPYIPEGKKLELMGNLLMEVNNVAKEHREFVLSAAYQNLPSEKELAEENKETEQAEAENITLEGMLPEETESVDSESAETEPAVNSQKAVKTQEKSSDITFEQIEVEIRDFIKKAKEKSAIIDISI